MKLIKLLIIILLLITFGCSKSNQSKEEELRLVIASPEVAEIVSSLGREDLIKGVTKECNYPSTLAGKTLIGTFGKVDVEKVIKLQPDIVFVSGLEQKHIAAELSKLGIRIEKVYPQTLMEMLESVTQIAELIGAEQEGQVLVAEMSQQIKELKSERGDSPPRIYVEIYGNPLMSVADSSYVGELVELAGFDNVFAELPRDYSRINPEKVLNAAPEYILLLYPEMTKKQVEDRKGWENVPAVKNSRIITTAEINPDLLVRATPRSLEGVKILKEYKAKDER